MSICGSGMLTRSLPFLPIISPRLMYLLQVALHLAADDLAEALVIAFDFLTHGNAPSRLAGVQAATVDEHSPPDCLRRFDVPALVLHSFFVCPRAKMLATKFSTSVATRSL